MSSAEGLVGREAELGFAAAAVRQLSERRASALAIDGEAGIGKTRLVQSIIDDARSRDVAVFCGQAHPFERTRPFGVVAAALDLSRRSPDSRRAAIGALLAGQGAGAPARAAGDTQPPPFTPWQPHSMINVKNVRRSHPSGTSGWRRTHRDHRPASRQLGAVGELPATRSAAATGTEVIASCHAGVPAVPASGKRPRGRGTVSAMPAGSGCGRLSGTRVLRQQRATPQREKVPQLLRQAAADLT